MIILNKQRKLICYGPFCYPKRIKHNREDLKTSRTNSRKHYCDRCFKYINKRKYNRRDLYRYIENKAHVLFPTGQMLNDISKLRKERHYTYKGLLTALKYANDHSLNFDFKSKYFLHYVPYIYEKAQEDRSKKDEHNDLVLNSTNINNQITNVKVNPKVFEHHNEVPKYDLSKF